MIIRESCYFCTSSFQIFAILAIAIERKESADLYIDPQFADAESLCGRIRKLGIFENVIVVDWRKICEKYLTKGPGFLNHLQIINSYIHVEKIVKLILLQEVNYKNIFLSSKAFMPRMVLFSFIKKNMPIHPFYFDDGTGSYENNRAYRIKFSDKVIRRLLFGKKANCTNYERYLFSPSIYYELNDKTDIDIISIKRFWENPHGEDIINRVFGINQKPMIEESLIILDQPKDELFTSENIESINNIYNRFVDTIGYENSVIKKHPRSSSEDFKNIKYFETNGIPFELYCLNVNMTNKILISYSSTAVATPKILFDQEPIVIVLTKLIKPITGEKNLFEDFFNAVKRAYRNPKRFMIPSNMDELIQIISMLNSNQE